MLHSLKGLLNVNKSTDVIDDDNLKYLVTYDVNVGGTILKHYQDKWAELHEINEVNASLASKLAETIEEVSKKIKKENDCATQIIHLLSPASNLQIAIDNCVSQLKDMHESFENTEKSLANLEDIIEMIELRNKKVEHEHQLELYKQNKLANFEELRRNLEEKHAKKIFEYELKQKKLLEERQQAFQEAFENDLKTYKQLGTVPRIQTSASQSSALLEEIQLDCNNDELDQFFK